MRNTNRRKLMKTQFKKLALATAVGAGMIGLSAPTHAIVEGVAGEALLVPYVVYDDTDGGDGDTGISVNTFVEITVPGSIGRDTVPNFFTAPNTTWTNPGFTIDPPDADLVPFNLVHWYFFDRRSLHLYNGSFPVTPDDMQLIDWGNIVRNQAPFLEGVPGYLIFGTEIARNRVAADFNMFGEAYVTIGAQAVIDTVVPPVPDAFTVNIIDAKIPVLAMSDGPDAVSAEPSVKDQVKYGIDRIPRAASPLISGMRTNYSDGVPDLTLFDLTLADRRWPSLHVIWLDVNGQGNQPVDVYDSDELSCSGVAPLDNELNVLYVNPIDPIIPALRLPPAANVPNGSAITGVVNYCLPIGATSDDRGFVRYGITEYIDNNIDEPESAGVAFSIQLTGVDPDNWGLLVPIETALGHERGKFQ
jgi:hypothetical protein